MRGTPLTKTLAVLFALTLASFASPAKATPIGLVLEPTPDVFSNFISVDYDATLDVLSVSGFASTLDIGGGQVAIAGGTYDLVANIDVNGVLSGGTISIGGTVASEGFNSGTLLTGNLTAFGFPDGGAGTFEFVFDVTGGDLAGLYGATGGTLLSANGYSGSFASDFGTTFTSVSDTAPPVPEPGQTLLLLSTALVALGTQRGRALGVNPKRS